MTVIYPDFVKELYEFGVETALECFNCGNCVQLYVHLSMICSQEE